MTLTAYADVDHAGCQDTRRSTSGSAQFLGDKLVMFGYCSLSSKHSLSISTWPKSHLNSRFVDSRAYSSSNSANPIYKIVVDILKHTNFFRAFTASSTISSIYIQQFWDTIRYVKNTGSYSCQLDEQWFDLTKDTLKYALQITPVDNNNPFSSPPKPDALINFVNELDYPKVGSSIEPILIMHERMREEFTQSIHSFVEDKKNLALHTQGKKKANPLVIPSVRFTKLIIHHLQSKHKFHPRPDSPLHLPYEEYVLGYLKFSAKGTKREVFGMPIPNDLITDDIRGEQYYNEYLEKVAKHQRYLAGEEVSDPDSPAPKPAKATKPKATKQSKPLAPKAAPKDQSKKRKLVKESSEAPSPAKRPKAGKVIKKRKPKSSLQLIDEFVDEGVPDKEPVEPDSGKFQPLLDVQGKGKEKFSDEQVALDLLTIQTPKKKSLVEQYIFQRRSSTPTEPSGHDESSSSLYAELGLTDSETESDEEVPGIDAGDQDEGQAGPNPSIQDEGQAGSNLVEEQVVLEEPASSTGTLSSLQHLAKDFSFGDQFFNDKPSDVENEKTTAETKAESMVSVTIHQDTSAIPPMTSPVIDLISRPDSPNEHRPLPAIATATATTTTSITTLPLPPQPQQSTTDSILIKRIVDEIVTDVVDWAIQAPLRDHFRDLPEADMKEILHHRMWETNSYKAHEDHKKLYEALEKSLDRDHSDQLLTDLAEA
ncbi:hypothetical protein Tco_1216599 [Tanacetum coccineum]